MACHTDSLHAEHVAMFQGAYPQLNIKLNWNKRKTTDNLAPFLGHFFGAFSSKYGVAYELNDL